jgi:hypothetical protein
MSSKVKREQFAKYNTFNGPSTNHIERLKKDFREVGHYIKKLEKKGDRPRLHLLRLKQQCIYDEIIEIEDYYSESA